MMKSFLIILFTLWTSTCALAQINIDSISTKPINVVNKFVNELANADRATDIILSQQVIVNNPSPDLYDYLEVSLEEIRLNLQYKNLEELEYIPYRNMKAKRLRDIDVEGLSKENIYFVEHKGKHVLALYITDNKIASFTLVSKGKNQAHFVFY